MWVRSWLKCARDALGIGSLVLKWREMGSVWVMRWTAGTRAADRCVLAVDNPSMEFSQVRDFSSLKIGERVYSIGAPRGLELTLTEGIVSGKRTHQGQRYIQTTAPISKGSSGGGSVRWRGASCWDHNLRVARCAKPQLRDPSRGLSDFKRVPSPNSSSLLWGNCSKMMKRNVLQKRLRESVTTARGPVRSCGTTTVPRCGWLQMAAQGSLSTKTRISN